MSNNIKGVTFANQQVTPSDFGAFCARALRDGFLSGCALSYSGATLTMAAGYGLLAGRIVRYPSANTFICDGLSTGYARLSLVLDLTQTATADTWAQGTLTVDYSATLGGFPALTQGDINEGDTDYASELCVVELSGGAITGIVRNCGAAIPDGVALLDSDGKVLPSQASSTIKSVPNTLASPYTLTAADAGCLLLARNENDSGQATYGFIVPENVFPVGTELEIHAYYLGTVTIAPETSDVKLYVPGSGAGVNSLQIANRHGSIALKQVFANYWIVAGDVGTTT